MEIFAALGSVLSDPVLLGWVLLAAIVGMIVGAIPGLTASAAIAMLLPLTFYMEPLPALAFLYVIGKSGRYGGSIAAILFNTPGTAASAATQLDGYPLARQGKAGKAMKVATISSVIGDFTGEILLIVGVAWIATIALKLGPPELFAVYFAAFIVIGSVIGKSVTRGLASAALGVLVAMIGLDPISATERFTFNSFDLTNGISLVPLMIGIFVLGEVFTQIEERGKKTEMIPDSDDASRNRLTWAEYKTCLPHVIRSSFIGSFIGMLPGLGSAIAAFVAYGEGKRRAKNPDDWGKGALEGVAAPEAANNAVSGPSMAPLLTLGIPGSTIGAILIGVFLIHGIQIGPTLFLTSRDLVYALFACGLIGIVMYGLIGYYGAAFVGRFITRIPTRVLYPVIFLTSFVASYTSRGNLFDVYVMVAAGFMGWLMRKLDFNPAAFVISFVLAGGAEETFRQALLLSDNGVMIFITRPIALMFLLIGLAALIVRIRSLNRQARAVALEDA
ncbi:tripartite tricarboxylate transporter permease [Parasulfitobacter algicola]|uniref:Tripartite tricarboxylate transporter permease n=1 Tax=Parasulfitobacter algicola TaxID=2614809 RepID=A0ABX2IS28_9RHOB|nr:tripartite tricarboxylate transporter permease [Sulfitobacter algicola]NSX55709.1 tripartite tricarboxylate transporter permease [Sulfitobacter algicola]